MLLISSNIKHQLLNQLNDLQLVFFFTSNRKGFLTLFIFYANDI